MTRGVGRAGRFLVAGVVLVALAIAAVVVFFPADALRARFESTVSGATGYTVTTRSLGLGVSGFSLALRVEDLAAVSPDGSQTITMPGLHVRVALLPLLRKEIEIRKLAADGFVLDMGPARREPPPQRGDAGGDGDGDRSDLVIPEIVLTGGRIVQRGDSGTTTLHGAGLEASYRSVAEGGRLDGRFTADSTLFAPAAAPDEPVRIPAIDLAFGSDIRMDPLAAATRLEGTVGAWPLHGMLESAGSDRGTRNSGTLEFDAVAIEVLRGFLNAAQQERIRAYALGGTLEDGRLEFETFPGENRTDYMFSARWTGARATLPDKGQVIDDGTVTLELRPDVLDLEGELALGRSSAALEARILEFADWTAAVRAQGPAADALRFLPGESGLDVASGGLSLDLSLSGRLGAERAPAAGGLIRLERVAFRHPAAPVPIDRLDLAARLDGRSVTFENGLVEAAGSDARFSGRLPDLDAPRLVLDVRAGTLDLGRLFPESDRPAAAAGAPASQEERDIPVEGRISVDRLVRRDLTMTGVTAVFAMTRAAVDLDGITGRVYGGRTRGDLRLAAAGPGRWDYSGEFNVDGVEAGELLSALTPVRGVRGTLRSFFRVSGRNGPGTHPLQSLSMTGLGDLLDGSIANVPAVQSLARVLKLEGFSGGGIPFREVRHRFRVENGFVIMDTMSVAQAGGTWRIGGRIGLDGRLDCPIATSLAPDRFAAGSDLRRLAELLAGADGRLPVTLHLGGTVTSPDVSVNLDPLLEAAREKAKDSLADELKKRLGGIFNRN